METIAYVLRYNGWVAAVILATSIEELETKLKTAIIEEVGAEPDKQFSVGNVPLANSVVWGETIKIKTSYVQDGFLVEDNEFTLTKTVSY